MNSYSPEPVRRVEIEAWAKVRTQKSDVTYQCISSEVWRPVRGPEERWTVKSGYKNMADLNLKFL